VSTEYNNKLRPQMKSKPKPALKYFWRNQN